MFKKGNAMPTPGSRAGARLREARKNLDLSQDDIAHQLGVSRVTISQWENNDTLPRGHRLSTLAKILNVSEQELKQFGLGGARESARMLSNAYLPLVTLTNLPVFLESGATEMEHMSLVAIDGVDDNTAFVMEMADESMTAGAPDDIADGERLIISRSEQVKPGDITLGAVKNLDGLEYVIRDYRPRAGGVFDLVPRSPSYETLSSTGRQSIAIVGVVIEHHKKLRR